MPLGSLRTRIEVALGRNGLAPGYVTYTDVSLHYQPPMMHWEIVPFKQGAWKGSYVGCVFIKTLWFNSDLAKMCIKSFKCLQILYLFTTFCWKQLSLSTCEQDFSYFLITVWYHHHTVVPQQYCFVRVAKDMYCVHCPMELWFGLSANGKSSSHLTAINISLPEHPSLYLTSESVYLWMDCCVPIPPTAPKSPPRTHPPSPWPGAFALATPLKRNGRRWPGNPTTLTLNRQIQSRPSPLPM